MKCPHCDWNNPKGFDTCFRCQQPLATGTWHAPRGHDTASNQNQAELPARLIASVIDLTIMAVGAITLLVIWWRMADTPLGDRLFLPLLLGAVGMLLLPGLSDPYGGSPGRRLLDIELRRPDGTSPGLLASLIRHSLKYGLLALNIVGLHLIARLLFKRDFLHEVGSSARVMRRQKNTI